MDPPSRRRAAGDAHSLSFLEEWLRERSGASWAMHATVVFDRRTMTGAPGGADSLASHL
jgi:hypothetical protein